MDRKRSVLVIAAVLLLAAAVFTYISLTGKDAGGDISSQGAAAATDSSAPVSAGMTDMTEAQKPSETSASVPQLLKTENVEVTGNSPEFNLKVQLCEDSGKRTFLKLEYYLDGAGTVLEQDDSRIPELAGIFEKRNEAVTTADMYGISEAYLNPVYSKLYVKITGKSSENYEDTSIYAIDLKNSASKKLFSFPGKYSKITFNKNFSLLGYSFADLPAMSNYQEKLLFSILDCKTDEFKVNASRTPAGKTAGNRDPAYMYDYSFTGWKSDTVASLKQTVYSRKDIDGKPTAEGDIMYDTVKDVFQNPDGSPAKTTTASTAQTDPASGVKGGTEAAKALTDFYSFLPSESNYSKAMNLLDDGFKLRLGLTEQFGVTEIIKSDIDAEGVSMYSEILKAASLDSIVKVELSGGTYTVYYYQTLSLNEESKVRQALSAEIKKTKNTYKIILIKDADEGKPPFAQ